MGERRIGTLIDECYLSFVEVRDNFHGKERIDAVEHEEKFYIEKFEDAGFDLNYAKNFVSRVYTVATIESGNKLKGLKEDAINFFGGHR